MVKVLLASVAATVAVPPAAAQTTQDLLLARLNANAGFRARVPRGHRAEGLAFAGSVAPGALVWEGDPMEVAILPRGLASTVVRNCQSRNTPTASGFLEGRFRETRSLTIEASITVGTSVSVEGSWPFGSVGAEQSLEVSTSVGTTSETSEELVFGQGFSTPVPPRTEFDIQLQMFEQKIAGQPFSFEAELRGPVRITHRPSEQWTSWRGSMPAGAVIAGRETSPTTGLVRALAVCRALRGNVWHPGKVVAGRCNYSFNGSESEATAFQVLVAPAGALAWRTRSAFEGEFDAATVRRGDSSGIEAGREARNDRYGGRLLVCRAAHEGGTHPGKVVINDCMFGYGGREVASGSFDVLTRTAAGTFTVNLQDYLPVEARSFRVEGSFEGARSMTYSVVYGAERPVDERFCPTAPVLASAERDGPAVRDASFAREPEPAATPARAPGSPGPSAAPGGPVPAAPLPSEPPIEGRVWIRAEVGAGDGDPVPRLVAFRLMRLERPHQLGADVLAVQEALRATGRPIRADGFFGPRTAAALREFQRSVGLAPDGIAGPRTLAGLGL